jgi:hypothetical protein
MSVQASVPVIVMQRAELSRCQNVKRRIVMVERK